jgi:phosphotransferase system  glucose/maltose/N-acetylglucosamine-specific IIC component
MDDLLTALLVVALISPAFAIGFSAYYYRLYRRAPQPKRHVPIASFILALLVSALVFYWLGTGVGIGLACSSTSSNLCGLFGFFVLGPIVSSLAIVVVAKVLSSNARKAL